MNGHVEHLSGFREDLPERADSALARDFRQVLERAAARKRHEVEMHVAAVVRHAQARAAGVPSRATSTLYAPPSEEALQARLASAAEAAAARATQAQGVLRDAAYIQAVLPPSSPEQSDLQAQTA